VYPVLFSILGEPVPAYFVLLLLGFACATWVQMRLAKASGLSGDSMIDLGIAMLIWGIVGSRLLHVLVDGHLMDYVHLCTDPSQVLWPVTERECATYEGAWDAALKTCHARERDCFAWAKFWAGGLTYYGGFIAATLAALVHVRREKQPFLKVADIAGVTIPLGLAFGRVGCFLGGCCYGRPSTSALAVVFPPGSDASRAAWKLGHAASPYVPSVSLHPTQLYESAGSLALAALCALYFQRRGPRSYDGSVFALFVALYGVLRFTVEFYRDDERGAFLSLSTSQWISLMGLALALTLHLAKKPRVVG
jgi:phosphatidylglycerol---prolipoprotein diacylglyceryl transferase